MGTEILCGLLARRDTYTTTTYSGSTSLEEHRGAGGGTWVNSLRPPWGSDIPRLCLCTGSLFGWTMPRFLACFGPLWLLSKALRKALARRYGLYLLALRLARLCVNV